MTAEDLMTVDPFLVRPRTTLRAAAELMRDHDARVLPVIEDQGMIGLLTDRDVVVRAITRGVGPLTGYVEDSMSPGGSRAVLRTLPKPSPPKWRKRHRGRSW